MQCCVLDGIMQQKKDTSEENSELWIKSGV